MNYVFAAPTRIVNYQLTKVLPWWFRRYILFRKGAKLEPLANKRRDQTVDIRKEDGQRSQILTSSIGRRPLSEEANTKKKVPDCYNILEPVLPHGL